MNTLVIVMVGAISGNPQAPMNHYPYYMPMPSMGQCKEALGHFYAQQPVGKMVATFAYCDRRSPAELSQQKSPGQPSKK